MGVIFLSYRRSDSRHIALNIYQWLIQHGIAPSDIFFDQSPETNQYGKRFPDSIQAALQSAKVLLALIGPAWVTDKRAGWFRSPRIMEDHDWVRREIATALTLNTFILPIRLDSAPMPISHQVPNSIRQLCSINSIDLHTDAVGFEQGMSIIGQTIAPHLQGVYHLAAGQFVRLQGARRRYLVQTLARYQQIMLPVGDIRLSLDAIFQPLKLRRDPVIPERQNQDNRLALLGEPRRDPSDPRRRGRPAILSAAPQPEPQRDAEFITAQEQGSAHAVAAAQSGDDALRQSSTRRMVVLGGPGTGKSTLLASFMTSAALRALQDPSAPIPIYISLPELARTGQWSRAAFPAFLEARLSALDAPTDYAVTLFELISTGQALLCLDGLDEVGPRIRPQILAWIKGLPEPVGEGATIIGTRFTEYRGGEFAEERFYEWELQPFDHQERLALATKLIPLLGAEIASANRWSHDTATLSETPEAPRAPEVFVSLLERHPRAAAWSENPLLFTLAAYVYCERGTLPDQRADLYRAIINAIVHNPARRTETSDADLKTTQDIIASVALELFASKGRTFSSDEMTDVLRPLCLALGVTDQRVGERYDRIVASGLLDVVANQVFGFRHLTFQEYLAAAALAWRLTEPTGAWRQVEATAPLSDTWSFLRKKRGMSRWSETLRLMTGVLMRDHGEAGRAVARKWLEELALLHTTEEGDPGYLALTLAAESLAELPLHHASLAPQDAQLAQVVLGAWIQALRRMALADRQAHVQKLVEVSGFLSVLPTGILEASLARLAVWIRSGYPLALRLAALRALGGFRKVAPFELYFDLMTEREYQIRDTVSINFGLLGADAPLDTLIARLTDDSWEVRECAAWSVGRVKNITAIEPLMAVVQGATNPRSPALWALTLLQPEVPVDYFVQWLTDTNEWVRYEAVRALKEHTAEVSVDAFVTLTKDTLALTRAEAVDALGHRAADAPIEPLVEALTDKESQVRLNAVRALGRVPDRAPIEPLLPLLTDPEERVRREALSSVNNMGARVPVDLLTQFLRECHALDRDVDAREMLGQVLLLAGLLPGSPLERYARALETLLMALQPAMIDGIAKFVEEIQRLQGRLIPVSLIISYTFEMGRDYLQKIALLTLEKLGARPPFEILQPFLTHSDEDVRSAAVELLANYETDAPLDLLVDRLRDDVSAQVRAAAAHALGAVREPGARQALLDALADEDLAARTEAIYALGGMEGDLSADLLLSAAAISANEEGEADGKEGADGRREAKLTAQLRVAVLWALGNREIDISAETLVPFMDDSSADVRLEALYTSERCAVRLPPSVLVKALHDEDKEIQERARTMLLAWREEALPALINGISMSAQPRGRSRELDVLQRMETLGYEQLAGFVREADYPQRRAALAVCDALHLNVPIRDLLWSLEDTDEAARWLPLHLLEQCIPGAKTEDHNGGIVWRSLADVAQESLRLPFLPGRFSLLDLTGGASFIPGLGWTIAFVDNSQEDQILLTLLLLGKEALNSEPAPAHDENFAAERKNSAWWWRAAALLERDGRDDATSLTAIARGLSDTERHVRAMAAWLAVRRNRLELIERALADDDDLVRATTVVAITDATHPSARAQVLAALLDPSARVRIVAAQRIREAMSAVSMQAFIEALARCAEARFEPPEKPSDPAVSTNPHSDPVQAGTTAMILAALAKAGQPVPFNAIALFLESPYITVRAAAFSALSSNTIQAPTPVIAAGLGDVSPSIQYAAMSALDQRAEPVEPSLLLPLVTHEDARIRRLALQILDRCGPSVSPDVFLHALVDEAYEVRGAAFNALVARQEHIPTDTLMPVALTATELGRSAFDWLLLHDPDAVIAEIPAFLAPDTFNTGSSTSRLQLLADACKRYPDLAPHVQRVLRTAALGHHDVGVRLNAIEALTVNMAHDDAEFIRAIQQCAVDANTRVAQAALKKLCELEVRIPLNIIEQGLESLDDGVRREALRCFAARQETIPYDILSQTVRDQSAQMRCDTLQYIRQRQDASLYDLAVDALDDTVKVTYTEDGKQVDSTLSEVAIALLRERAPASFPALIRALGHANDAIRWLAIQLLDVGIYEQGGSIPEEVIVRTLSDSYENVADRARSLLERLRPENVEEEQRREALSQEMLRILRGDGITSIIAAPLRESVSHSLAIMWPAYEFASVMRFLEESLDDNAWSVRSSAAYTLGTIQRRIPETAIHRMFELRRDPESVAVQLAADDALVKILSVDVIEDE